MAEKFITNYSKMPCSNKNRADFLAIWQNSPLSKVGAGLAFFQLDDQEKCSKQAAEFKRFVWGQNLDKQFRAASTIKIAIVAALFYEVQQGKVSLTDYVTVSEDDIVDGGILCEVGSGRQFTWRELARLAIVISDNSASNMIIKKLGFERINYFIKNILQVEQTTLNRYFMALPQEMGENYTSAQDLACMMAALWQGKVLQKIYNDEFWGILSRQQFIEKLPSRILGQVKNYNKTGELDDGARHDAAVFVEARQAWGLIALTDQQEIASWQIDWYMGAWSEQIYRYVTSVAE